MGDHRLRREADVEVGLVCEKIWYKSELSELQLIKMEKTPLDFRPRINRLKRVMLRFLKMTINIDPNDEAKMAILWPKIGQRHFGARASHGHNLAIFHSILTFLTNEYTKKTNSSRRIE